MIDINIDKNKKFYQQFKCEILTNNEENRFLVDKFKANDIGFPLEKYLKENAWEEDSDGETRVYLVKDMNNEVALFFSIKCGLLYEPHNYSRLESEKQEYVDIFIDAINKKDQKAIDSYFESGYYDFEETNKLYKIAIDRLEVKREGTELGDDISALKVHKCYSAIELRHFCKNANYRSKTENIPIGVGMFWEVVVPKICEITNLIGCKYLYLFAADRTDTKEQSQQTRKLLQYYRTDLKFDDIQDLMIIKPDYDRSCWGLIQEISVLKKNRETIWEEFSDVYE